MRRIFPGLLAVLLLASACGPAPVSKDVRKPKASASPAATPQASPSAGPGASPAASFAPVPATALAGLVKVDASYMVAAGAGNLLSQNGAQIVAAGAGNLVGPDGASLIGMDGGTLIGPDGATLVGPDGASLVGPDGASLVGPDGASYRTLAHAFRLQAADALPPGTQLPASRMRVRVYDLETGRPVLAARDPAARAGAFVLTDAQGRFQAPVLEAATGNVLVVADVLGRRDVRLRLGEIARPRAGGATAAIDEDLAVVTNYLRLILFARLREYIVRAPEEDGVIQFADTSVSQAEKDLANRVFGEIVAAAKAAHVERLTPAQLDRLIGRMGDLVLARMPIGEVAINGAWSNGAFVLPAGWAPDHPAHDALLGVIRAVNAAAAAKMAAGPLTLEVSTVDVAAKARVGPLRKPGDAGQLLVTRYVMPSTGGQFDLSGELFTQLGLPPTDRFTLKAGMDGFLLWAFLQLASDDPPDGMASGPSLRARLVALIEGAAALEDLSIPLPETDANREATP